MLIPPLRFRWAHFWWLWVHIPSFTSPLQVVVILDLQPVQDFRLNFFRLDLIKVWLSLDFLSLWVLHKLSVIERLNCLWWRGDLFQLLTPIPLFGRPAWYLLWPFAHQRLLQGLWKEETVPWYRGCILNMESVSGMSELHHIDCSVLLAAAHSCSFEIVVRRGYLLDLLLDSYLSFAFAVMSWYVPRWTVSLSYYDRVRWDSRQVGCCWTVRIPHVNL